MATLYSPRIVTNGLVLYLDAGNRRSYPGSGTSWTDLTGNGNTGTLTNGPTFDSGNGGSIVFDGVNDFVQTTFNSSFTAMTLMGFIKRNGSQGTYTGILFSRETSVTGLNFYTSNQLGYHWNDSYFTFNSNLTVPDNTWSMVTMSVTSTAATLYVNTSSVTNTASHGTTTINDLKLGQDEIFGNRFMNGNIATTLLYNRALTALEVTQNYNALRSRFGV